MRVKEVQIVEGNCYQWYQNSFKADDNFRRYNIQIKHMNFCLELIPDEEMQLPSLLTIDEHPQTPKKLSDKEKNGSQKRKHKINNPYKWKAVENTKYVNFLRSRLHLMQLSIAERKKLKINVLMSNYIKTRNPEQCRSHHQKMMIKYGTLENILASYSRDFKEAKLTENVEVQVQAITMIPEEELNNNKTDSNEAEIEPFWLQYLDLYSYHYSEQFQQQQDDL